MNLQTTFGKWVPPPTRTSFSSEEPQRKRGLRRQIPIPKQHRVLLRAQLDDPGVRQTLTLGDDVVRILGHRLKRRFDELRKYPNGWYGGQGKRLSPYSVRVFERFITRLQGLKDTNPAIFLTLDGNLSLSLDDKEHGNVELEFFPDKIEYFFETSDDEGSVGLGRAFELASQVNALVQ